MFLLGCVIMFRGGRGSASWGLHPGGLSPAGSAYRKGSAYRRFCIQGVGQNPRPTSGIREADGTHPTGMLSYPNIHFSMCVPKLVLVQIVDPDYYVIVCDWLGNELFCKNQGYDYQRVAG